METKKRKRSGLNIGSSLILVTFILLCLVAFAALSFTSANADYELSKQTAEKTSAYYNAVNLGEQYLADIDSAIKSIAASASSNESFLEEVKDTYKANSLITIVEQESTMLLCFILPINQSSGLFISLELKELGQITENSTSFDIINYQTITTTSPDTQTIEGDGGLIL